MVSLGFLPCPLPFPSLSLGCARVCIRECVYVFVCVCVCVCVPPVRPVRPSAIDSPVRRPCKQNGTNDLSPGRCRSQPPLHFGQQEGKSTLESLFLASHRQQQRSRASHRAVAEHATFQPGHRCTQGGDEAAQSCRGGTRTLSCTCSTWPASSLPPPASRFPASGLPASPAAAAVDRSHVGYAVAAIAQSLRPAYFDHGTLHIRTSSHCAAFCFAATSAFLQFASAHTTSDTRNHDR